MSKIDWYVYMVVCSDNSFYIGISNNVLKRINTHNAGKGARYTRCRRPVKVVYTEGPFTKSDACKREHFYKSFSRKQKLSLISI